MKSRFEKFIKQGKFGFVVPLWWECGWRRNACNRPSCRLCGQIVQNRAKHIARGEDPDSMQAAMEDISENFRDTIMMVRNKAQQLGIDLDDLDEEGELESEKEEEKALSQDQLRIQVYNWHRRVYAILKRLEVQAHPWLKTEPAFDLSWYANTLYVKTQRQLTNRRDLDRGDEYARLDYNYTRHVLDESVAILKEALKQLLIEVPVFEKEALEALSKIKELRNKLLSI